jgi:hypothetical protein
VSYLVAEFLIHDHGTNDKIMLRAGACRARGKCRYLAWASEHHTRTMPIVQAPGEPPLRFDGCQGLDYPEALKIILTGGGFACLFALSLSLSLLRSH